MAFLALSLWLLTSFSGAHGHLCFDGQEPPISVHMDVLDDHTKQHFDAHVDLSQQALAKGVKIYLPLLIAAALLLPLLLETRAVFITYYHHLLYSRCLAGLRPPLRAPPIFSA